MNRVKGEKRPGVLPSPNWYLPAIASVNEEGQLAFGARNEVYIVDVRTQWLEKRMGGQEGRISSVCFLHGPLPLLAASSDRTLCLWNYEKGSVHARHKEHKADIMCIASPKSPHHTVISGDKEGRLVMWTEGGQTVSFKPTSHSITSISLHPTFHDLAAIGYSNGMIIFLSLRSGQVVLQSNPASESIISLAFSPSPNQVKNTFKYQGTKKGEVAMTEEDKVTQERPLFSSSFPSSLPSPSPPHLPSPNAAPPLFLAFISKDGVLGLYSVFSPQSSSSSSTLSPNPPYEISLYRTTLLKPNGTPSPDSNPKRPTNQKKASSSSDSSRAWFSLTWIDALRLLTSTSQGDILVWDASTLTSTKWCHAHSRTIFQLLPSVSSSNRMVPTDSSASRANQIPRPTCSSTRNVSRFSPLLPHFIVSLSMDRNICLWHASKKTKLWEMSTLGGYIYQISKNPSDPTSLALACGDNAIRIWSAQECIHSIDRFLKTSAHEEEENGNAMLIDATPSDVGETSMTGNDKLSNTRLEGRSMVTASATALGGSSNRLGPSLFSMTLIWKNISSKVTCVKWHPERGEEIAWGMEDGRLMTCSLATSSLHTLDNVHKLPVYDIAFLKYGPGDWVLASVAGDGEIVFHILGEKTNRRDAKPSKSIAAMNGPSGGVRDLDGQGRKGRRGGVASNQASRRDGADMDESDTSLSKKDVVEVLGTTLDGRGEEEGHEEDSSFSEFFLHSNSERQSSHHHHHHRQHEKAIGSAQSSNLETGMKPHSDSSSNQSSIIFSSSQMRATSSNFHQMIASNPRGTSLKFNEMIVSSNPHLLRDLSSSIGKIYTHLPKRTHFAQREDALLLGNSDGSLELYAWPSLLLLWSKRLFTRMVNRIIWLGPSDAIWEASDDGSRHETDLPHSEHASHPPSPPIDPKPIIHKMASKAVAVAVSEDGSLALLDFGSFPLFPSLNLGPSPSNMLNTPLTSYSSSISRVQDQDTHSQETSSSTASIPSLTHHSSHTKYFKVEKAHSKSINAVEALEGEEKAPQNSLSFLPSSSAFFSTSSSDGSTAVWLVDLNHIEGVQRQGEAAMERSAKMLASLALPLAASSSDASPPSQSLLPSYEGDQPRWAIGGASDDQNLLFSLFPSSDFELPLTNPLKGTKKHVNQAIAASMSRGGKREERVPIPHSTALSSAAQLESPSMSAMEVDPMAGVEMRGEGSTMEATYSSLVTNADLEGKFTSHVVQSMSRKAEDGKEALSGKGHSLSGEMFNLNENLISTGSKPCSENDLSKKTAMQDVEAAGRVKKASSRRNRKKSTTDPSSALHGATTLDSAAMSSQSAHSGGAGSTGGMPFQQGIQWIAPFDDSSFPLQSFHDLHRPHGGTSLDDTTRRSRRESNSIESNFLIQPSPEWLARDCSEDEWTMVNQFVEDDVAEMVSKQVRKGRKLNEGMVALAAVGGYALWKSTCYAFADQLAHQGDCHKAAMYYLAVRDVEKAIAVYEAHHHYQDAINLGTRRLCSVNVVTSQEGGKEGGMRLNSLVGDTQSNNLEEPSHLKAQSNLDSQSNIDTTSHPNSSHLIPPFSDLLACRVPKLHPRVEASWKLWANHLSHRGMHSQAAYCFATVSDFPSAILQLSMQPHSLPHLFAIIQLFGYIRQTKSITQGKASLTNASQLTPFDLQKNIFSKPATHTTETDPTEAVTKLQQATRLEDVMSRATLSQLFWNFIVFFLKSPHEASSSLPRLNEPISLPMEMVSLFSGGEPNGTTDKASSSLLPLAHVLSSCLPMSTCPTGKGSGSVKLSSMRSMSSPFPSIHSLSSHPIDSFPSHPIHSLSSHPIDSLSSHPIDSLSSHPIDSLPSIPLILHPSLIYFDRVSDSILSSLGEPNRQKDHGKKERLDEKSWLTEDAHLLSLSSFLWNLLSHTPYSSSRMDVDKPIEIVEPSTSPPFGVNQTKDEMVEDGSTKDQTLHFSDATTKFKARDESNIGNHDMPFIFNQLLIFFASPLLPSDSTTILSHRPSEPSLEKQKGTPSSSTLPSIPSSLSSYQASLILLCDRIPGVLAMIDESKDGEENQQDGPTMLQEDPRILQREDQTMLLRKDQTIFQREDPTMLLRKDQTIFQREDQTMLLRKDQTILQRKDQTILQSHAHEPNSVSKPNVEPQTSHIGQKSTVNLQTSLLVASFLLTSTLHRLSFGSPQSDLAYLRLVKDLCKVSHQVIQSSPNPSVSRSDLFPQPPSRFIYSKTALSIESRPLRSLRALLGSHLKKEEPLCLSPSSPLPIPLQNAYRLSFIYYSLWMQREDVAQADESSKQVVAKEFAKDGIANDTNQPSDPTHPDQLGDEYFFEGIKAEEKVLVTKLVEAITSSAQLFPIAIRELSTIMMRLASKKRRRDEDEKQMEGNSVDALPGNQDPSHRDGSGYQYKMEIETEEIQGVVRQDNTSQESHQSLAPQSFAPPLAKRPASQNYRETSDESALIGTVDHPLLPGPSNSVRATHLILSPDTPSYSLSFLQSQAIAAQDRNNDAEQVNLATSIQTIGSRLLSLLSPHHPSFLPILRSLRDSSLDVTTFRRWEKMIFSHAPSS